MDKPEEANNGSDNQEAHQSFLRHWWILVVVVLVAVAAMLLPSCRKKEELKSLGERSKVPSRAIPVSALPAQKADFHTYLTGLGTVTPVNRVTVRTRVDGQLLEVLFQESQIVRSGDLLARIDPRPFEVQLLQAQGQMARDSAQLKNARLDLERYQKLWKQDSTSQQQLDTQEALVRQLEGTVKSDQGLVESAQLQLVYCQITSPIAGRVGLRLVDPGNIVHASDANGLVVITQIEPITVIFPIPQNSLPSVLAKFKKGVAMPIEAYNQEMNKKLAVGFLQSFDNQIDLATGTVRLRGIFANKERQLFPNQFVNARLLVNVLQGATVIPAAAIQQGPQGPFVFVVKPDLRATIRPVSVIDTEGGEAAIQTGLSPGELVVVDGAEKLREGSLVDMKAQLKDRPISPTASKSP
jgi:membrane fusion protein, multidrug efflux system